MREFETSCTFKEMTNDDIKHNLEVISKLNIGEKLMIDDVRLYVDNRWFRDIRRIQMLDNRKRICALIAHTYYQLLKNKKEYNEEFYHDELQNYFTKSFNGLNKIIETYNYDPHVIIFINEMIRLQNQ